MRLVRAISTVQGMEKQKLSCMVIDDKAWKWQQTCQMGLGPTQTSTIVKRLDMHLRYQKTAGDMPVNLGS